METYHSRREIGVRFSREDVWIKTTVALSTRRREYVNSVPTRYRYEMKPDVFTGELWPVYVDANKHIRRRVEFEFPKQNDGSTMWISTR